MTEPTPSGTPSPSVPTPPQGPPPGSWRERLELLGADELPVTLRGAGAVLAVVGIAVAGWLLLREPPPPVESSLPQAAPASTVAPAPAEVVAQAAGAVQRPGLYRLPDGARIADLVDAAGGATGDADLDRVNLAARLADGSQVRVPRVGEPDLPAPAGAAGGVADGPLDLNAATAEQLDALPGIGPATAAAIVAERAERGRFRSVDELEEVRGIGPAKLDALRDLVRV